MYMGKTQVDVMLTLHSNISQHGDMTVNLQFTSSQNLQKVSPIAVVQVEQ